MAVGIVLMVVGCGVIWFAISEKKREAVYAQHMYKCEVAGIMDDGVELTCPELGRSIELRKRTLKKPVMGETVWSVIINNELQGVSRSGNPARYRKGDVLDGALCVFAGLIVMLLSRLI